MLINDQNKIVYNRKIRATIDAHLFYYYFVPYFAIQLNSKRVMYKEEKDALVNTTVKGIYKIYQNA